MTTVSLERTLVRCEVASFLQTRTRFQPFTSPLRVASPFRMVNLPRTSHLQRHWQPRCPYSQRERALSSGAACQLDCTHRVRCPIRSGGIRKESESDSHQAVLTLMVTTLFPDFTKLFESPEQIRIAGRTAPDGIPLSDGKQSRRSALGHSAQLTMRK